MKSFGTRLTGFLSSSVPGIIHSVFLCHYYLTTVQEPIVRVRLGISRICFISLFSRSTLHLNLKFQIMFSLITFSLSSILIPCLHLYLLSENIITSSSITVKFSSNISNPLSFFSYQSIPGDSRFKHSSNRLFSLAPHSSNVLIPIILDLLKLPTAGFILQGMVYLVSVYIYPFSPLDTPPLPQLAYQLLTVPLIFNALFCHQDFACYSLYLKCPTHHPLPL